MIAQFVEVTDGLMYGKFLVLRMSVSELMTETAMPEAPPGQPLLTYGGRRRFNDHSTAVYDLQRGTGFVWPLEGGEPGMWHYTYQHLDGIVGLVCPMYLPFVRWLHEQGKWAMGKGDITEIPRYIDLRDVPEE